MAPNRINGPVARPNAAMRVIETAIYRGPHLYSLIPMIRIQIDLAALESWPSDRIDGLAERLLQLLPGLGDHGCSYGEPGGFVRRLNEGTWLGHVTEHIALELQNAAGARVTRGKTRSVKGKPGVYNVMYAAMTVLAGVAALCRAAAADSSTVGPAYFGDRAADPEDETFGYLVKTEGACPLAFISPARNIGPITGDAEKDTIAYRPLLGVKRDGLWSFVLVPEPTLEKRQSD